MKGKMGGPKRADPQPDPKKPLTLTGPHPIFPLNLKFGPPQAWTNVLATLQVV